MMGRTGAGACGWIPAGNCPLSSDGLLVTSQGCGSVCAVRNETVGGDQNGNTPTGEGEAPFLQPFCSGWC